MTEASIRPDNGASEIQPAPASATSNTQEVKNAAPVPAFKVVRVRKPDGTIVKVRRPIEQTVKAEEKSEVIAPSASTTKVISAELPTTKTTVSPISDIPSPINGADTQSSRIHTSSPTAKITIVNAQPPNSPKPKPAIATTTSSDAVKNDMHKYDVAIPEKAITTFTNGSRMFTTLRRLGTHGSRVVGALVPDWDLGDFEDGDEQLSDDDEDSDDERFDSDNDDKDSMDEKDHGGNTQGNQDHDKTDYNEKDANEKSEAAGQLATAAAKTSSKQMNIPRPLPAVHTTGGSTNKSTELPSKVSAPKTVSVNEKELLDDETKTKATVDPESGRKVFKSSSDWTRYVIWTIELALPLLFIIVGILVACMNGKDFNSTLSTGIQQTLKVTVSIWPIIIAAVTAQSLRVYATYKVERGVRLMTLEQLVSSHSVAASVKVPFILRRFNLVTIALLALWALSPLASQAMQRVYKPVDSYIDDYGANMSYVNTYDASNIFNLTSHTSYTQYQHDYVRLYAAIFLPGDHSDGTDNFRNPLIPVLDLLPNTTSTEEEDYYLEVDPVSVDRDNSWASLYGIPIVPVDVSSSDVSTISSKQKEATKNKKSSTDTSGTTTPNDIYYFDIKASYLTLNCSFLNETTMDVIAKNYPQANETLNNIANPKSVYVYMSDYEDPAELVWVSATQNGVFSDAALYAYSICSVTRPVVSASVWCDVNGPNDTSCSVFSLSRDSAPTFNVSSFADPFSVAVNVHGAGVTDTERYIMDPYNLLAPSHITGLALSNLTITQFSRRLSVLLTSFWQIGYAPTYYSTALPVNTNNQTVRTDVHVAIAGADATREQTVQLWKTSWAWLVPLFICCAFLLVAAIFSIFWDTQTISPDVLGFASSVLRKSKYVQLPAVDSAASGAERARALGEIRVMMQDVKPGAAVGRIALGTAHPNAQRLQQGRFYR